MLLEFGPFVIDSLRRQVFCGQSPVLLTSKPFEVLLYLAENSARVIEKAEILETIWKGVSVSQPNLAQTIFVLRSALRRHDPSPYIVTVRGSGYQFAAEVRRRRSRSEGSFVKAIIHFYPCRRASRPASPVHQTFANYTAGSLRAVMDRSRDAMREQPRRAAHYVDYANALCLLVSAGHSRPQDVFPAVQDVLLRALEVDPGAGAAYAPLGFLRCHLDRDWARAEENFQLSLADCPHDLMAHHWYGELLGALQRYDESLKLLRRAEKFYPESALIRTDIAQILFNAKAYADCEAQLLRCISPGTDFPFANILLGCTYRFRRRYDEAVRALEQAASPGAGPLALAALTATHALIGNACAGPLLKKLQAQRTRCYVPPSLVAFAAAGLGKTDLVLRFLELGEKENDYWFLWFSAKTIFDPLRREPRFRRLLQKARLA